MTGISKMLPWDLIIRYVLGLIMFAYGLIKIVGSQFILPSSIYSSQLKELDGVTLTWAFLGFSSWFSILIGLFELIPALLLLFKRTKLLGAILLFPTVFAVFLINNAYGFLPHMRVLTTVLLLMDISLLAVNYKVFMRFFEEMLSDRSVSKMREITINLILMGLVAFLIIYNFT